MTTRRGEDPLWLTALGLLALLLLAGGFSAGIYIAMRQGLPMASTTGNSTESIETMLLEDPAIGPMMTAVKRHYPDDYADVSERAQEFSRGRPSIVARNEAERMTRNILPAYLPDVAQAPGGDLRLLHQAQLRIVEQLQKTDSTVCARFLAGERDAELFPDDVRPLVAEIDALVWRVAAAGRDFPAQRKQGPITTKESVAMTKAMRASGMTDGDFELMSSRGRGDLTAEQRCTLALQVNRAVAAAPEEHRDRLFILSTLGNGR
jgi:hypothetical protein